MLIRNNLFVLKIRNSAGRELIQYTLVGISGVIFNLGLLYVLTEFLNFYYIVSAFFVGLIISLYNFSLEKVWVFREKLKERYLKEYFSYMIFGGIAIVVNMGLLYFFTSVLGIYYIISQAISILIIGLFTFTCNEIWTFKARRKKLRA